MTRRRLDTPGPVRLDLEFPLEGVDEQRSFVRQRPGTTPDAVNVCTFDPATGRARGGSRPGTTRYFPGTAGADESNAGYSIQAIEHFACNSALQTNALDIGQSLFSLGSGGGFDFVDDAGALISNNGPFGAVSGHILECSTWDAEDVTRAELQADGVTVKNTTQQRHFCYVATHDQSATATATKTRLYKVEVDRGYPNSGESRLDPVWHGAGTAGRDFPLATVAGFRGIVGMAVVGKYLYVAARFSATEGRIYRFDKVTGNPTTDPKTGGSAAGLWFGPNHNSQASALAFSLNAVNCLGACGTLLGVDSCGSNNANYAFYILDTTQIANAKKMKVRTLYDTGGTRTQAASKVISDGVGFFYVIASVSATEKQVRCYTLGGVLVWVSAGATTATDICYDPSEGKLLVATGSTPSIKSLSLTSGATLASADPDSITNWTNISSSGNQFYTIWRAGAAATKDAAGINSSLSLVWGGSTLAGATTTNVGASSNPGKQLKAPDGGAYEVRGLLVSNGTLKTFDTKGANAVSGGAQLSHGMRQIFGAPLGQYFWFADGSKYWRYSALTNTLAATSLTDGTLPVDSNKSACRIVELWRGRLVYFSLVLDPHNYFMCRQFDGLDMDYGATPETIDMAVSGSTSDAGLVGDVITGFIPFNDDVGIWLCDHEIWQMTGDPAEGGRLDRLSGAVGGAWGRAWCLDPYGQAWFYSQHGCVYSITPGSAPVPRSQQIARRLENVDLTTHRVRMAWDLRRRGLWLFITPLDERAETTHYFYESMTEAWWPVEFDDPNHNPLAVHVYDGPLPDDRRILLGGRDGKLRYIDDAAPTDDGRPIYSRVKLPLVMRDYSEVRLDALQATLGAYSGDVAWKVFAGRTCEQALASAHLEEGTWRHDDELGGRNTVSPVRRAGHALYVEIGGTGAWSLEKLTAHYTTLGRQRARG